MDDGPANVRVLVVDDHPDTLTLQAMLLRKRGYEVLTASSAAAALDAAAEAERIDLLVSDIRLPDRSGLELMRELRRGGEGPAGIALTGAADDNLVARCRHAGFAEVLVKPILPDQLLEAVAAATGRPSP